MLCLIVRWNYNLGGLMMSLVDLSCTYFENDFLTLYNDKAEDVLEYMVSNNYKFDTIITSPPYNFNKLYNKYSDNLEYMDYLMFIDNIVSLISKVMDDSSSFFLNIGHKPSFYLFPYDIVNICRKYFILQNNFIWTKALTVNDDSYGHFKPINSNRYVNDLWENVFHFTLNGDVEIDRLSNGVSYKDKTNIKRWSSKKDNRCKGNVWYIPYNTVNSKKNHPAQFPVELPSNCLRLMKEPKLVLDPFIGVGNTAIACKDLGIKCVGIDIDNTYLDECIKIFV